MYNEETIKYLADNLETTADGILRECDPADIRLMFEEETKMEDDPSHAGKTFVDLFKEDGCQISGQTGGKRRNGRSYL